jgi:hypothetical protein
MLYPLSYGSINHWRGDVSTGYSILVNSSNITLNSASTKKEIAQR